MLYHLLVPLHLETKESIVVEIHKPSDLNVSSLKVVRRKEVIGLRHVLGVVESINEFVLRDPGVV